MLKKRNMAMMMAAATVATSVAPVFASVSTEVVTDEAKLISDVTKMLDTRYTNSREDGKGGVATETYQNSVYEIVANGTTVIKNVAQLKSLIEANKVSETTLNIVVTDKGHKVVDGVTVATEKNEYVKYTSEELDKISANSIIESVTDKTQDASGKTTSATITLKNTDVDPIVVSTDSYQLDLSKPVDKDGNLIDPNTTDSAMAKKVVGFKNLETGKVVENDIPSEVVAKYDVRTGGYTKIEANVAQYISNGIYTEDGEALVNTLVKANNDTSGTDTATVIKDGKEYTIVCNTAGTDNDLSAVEVNKDGGYKLTVNLKATLVNARAITAGSNVQIVIKSDSQKELADLRAAMQDTTLVEAGKGLYTSLAGEDRFETAIAISQESYVDSDESPAAGKENAGAVVLVGEDAIVDGLAAAPLAKQLDAPVLLTKKNAVGDSTLAEMKRVIGKDSTVYLVGGESVISKDVEAQLIKEMNAKIVRLAGEDRFETSTKIANHMLAANDLNTVESIFVVGGDGEADAMSIASVASRETDADTNKIAPIIVSPAAGLTKDAKYFIEKNKATITDIAVIGGEAKVSTQVLKDIKDAADTSATRLAGETRQETNSEVIKTYYSSATSLYVAKDGYVGGNGKLIDALAVAPLAGRDGAPIVLATEDLTNDQTEAVEVATNPSTSNSLVKVGNGISSTLMSKLVKLLGLQ